jgi:hypothetical protein
MSRAVETQVLIVGAMMSASSRLAASRFSRACFNVTVG